MPDPICLPLNEAASYLGMSPYRLKKYGPPPLRVGNGYFYSKEALRSKIVIPKKKKGELPQAL